MRYSYFVLLLFIISALSCKNQIHIDQNTDSMHTQIFDPLPFPHFDSLLDASITKADQYLKANKSDFKNNQAAYAFYLIKKTKLILRTTRQDYTLVYLDSAINLSEKNTIIGFDSYLAYAKSLQHLGLYESSSLYYDSVILIAKNLKIKKLLAETYLGKAEIQAIRWKIVQAKHSINAADSLYSLINDPIGKVRTRQALDYAIYRDDKLHEALDSSFETQKIAASIKDSSTIYKSLALQAHIYDHFGNYAPAIDRYKRLLARARAGNNNFEAIRWLNELTYANRMVGNFDQSIYYGNKSIEVSDTMGYELGKADAHIRLYQIYHDNKQVDKELAAIDNAMAIYQKLSTRSGIAESFNSYGNAFEAKQEFQKAFEAYEKAFEIRKTYTSSYWVIPLYNLGNTKIKLNQPKESLPYLKESLQICIDQGIIGMKVRNLLGISEAEMLLGNLNQSIKTISEAEKIVTKTKYQRMKRDTYGLMAKVYAESENFEQAFFAYKRHKELEDSLFNDASNQRFANFEVKFETQKKEQENDMLKKDLELGKSYTKSQNQFIVFIGLLLAFAILVIFLFIRNNKKLQSSNELIARQSSEISSRNERIETLLSEVHHRVKNNLQLISSLLDIDMDEVQNNQTHMILLESQSRVATMSLIHQNLYMNDDFSRIDIHEYMDQLIGQLTEINAIQEDLNFHFESGDFLFDVDTMIPLGLITTELVTNAFKYSIGKNNQYYIAIEILKKDKDFYQMTISDKGPDLPKPLNVLTKEGFGLRLASRLSMQLGGELNHQYKEGNYFSVNFQYQDHTSS